MINKALENTYFSDEVKEIISSNFYFAIDDAERYDATLEFREGDAYAQNTFDTCIENKIDHATAEDALTFFKKIGLESGLLRFAFYV